MLPPQSLRDSMALKGTPRDSFVRGKSANVWRIVGGMSE
jgi:hypothetical protein